MGVSSKQANHMNNRTSHVIADSDGYPRLYMLKLNRANNTIFQHYCWYIYTLLPLTVVATL